MMAAILNSTMLDSDTAILNSDTLLSSLRFTQKHSHSILTLTQTNSIWLKVIHSHLTWWWQPSCILPSWILTSWILPFCSKLWLQLIQSDSKSFILTQLDDGSHLGFSHFAQQKLHSFILTQLDDGSHIEFCHIGFSHFAQKNFTHFFWLNLMIAAILNSAKLNSTILDSTILVFPLKLTHTCQDWFPPFAQKILHSFILTQLDDGSYLEFCQLEFHHLGFNHLRFSSQTHSHLPRLVPNICTKKLHSFILTQLDDCSYLEICHPQFSHFVQKILHSFILTQLDDGSHLEFCHLEFHHLGFILNSAILDFPHSNSLTLDDGNH